MTASLDPLRRRIDALDDRLIDLLAERFAIVREVAVRKREEGLSVVQPERARLVVERNAERAAAKDLDPDLVRRIWTMMIDAAHVIEDRIVAPDGASSDGRAADAGAADGSAASGGGDGS